MGWYGTYSDNFEVASERKNDRDFNSRHELLDEKIMKSYGLLLYKNRETSEIFVDHWIFRGEDYKPLGSSLIECYKKLPKNWLPMLDQEEILEAKNYYKTEAEQKKKHSNKLEEILVVGKTYEIYGYQAIYKFKRKRSHIFEVNGSLTRFTRLTFHDVKELVF